METALKSQLNKLKISQKSQPILPSKCEASFLFDLEHSKRIDTETIYEIGYSGLIDIARHNQNFVKYFNTIFNSTSKYFNREVKREEELKEVDENLNELLTQLIPFFRHKPTHKIIEYLIRIYNVNVYNKKVLLFSFLPYHETKLFSKLIQLMNFDQLNHLKFFSIFAKEGKVVMKEYLYKEMSSNYEFLKEIFNFYDEYVTSSKNYELDDSSYLTFIFEMCQFILKNISGKIAIDVNRLNLIIQFLNKNFKILKNKISVFKRSNYDDEGEYEVTLVIQACELINVLIAKLSITSEFKNAFVNDLINKALILVDQQKSIESIIRTVLIILGDSKNSKDDSILLSKETLSNLEEIYSIKRNFREVLRKISEEFDLVILVKTILKSSKVNLGIVKNLLKDNFFSQDNLKKLILFLYDSIIVDTNTENNEYLHLLHFIEEVHSEKFNSILIDLFTNTKDQDYLIKLQKVTSKINMEYQTILSTNDLNVSCSENSLINPFNLFLNLNQTNVNTVLNSIRKIDEIFELNDDKQREFLMKKIVPSLSNKFIFIDREIILNEIINLRHCPDLINNYSQFKNDLVNFFFTLCERQIELYSEEFLSKLVDFLVQFTINEDNESSLKIMTYIILFRFYKENLFQQNSYTKKLFPSSTDFDAFIDYLSLNKEEKICSIKFMETVRELLKNLKLNKNSKFDISLTILLIGKNLTKEKEKFNSESNTVFLRVLEILTEILNLDFFKSENKASFNSLSGVMVNLVKSASQFSTRFSYDGDIREIMKNLTNILLSNYNLNMFKDLIEALYIEHESIQKYLAYIILESIHINENLLQYVKNHMNSWKTGDLSLISALVYSLSISNDGKTTSIIIDIISNLNNKRISSSNFNKFSNIQNSIDEQGTEKFTESIDELLSRRNEILVNKGNVKKIISSLMNESVYETILLTFLKDANITNLILISKILSVFSFGINTPNKSKDRHSQLINISETFILDLTSLHSSDLAKDNYRQDFIQLTQLLSENLLNLYKKSAFEIVQLLVNISEKFRFDQIFVEKLFNKTNFELVSDTRQNLHKLHKIIKFALTYSISSDSFVTYDDEFCLNFLRYILDAKLISNKENEFFISYVFEIIFKSKNYYFDINYIKLTTEMLQQLDPQANSESNSVFLNLSNNLLTIITNSTIESEEKKEVKLINAKLEQTIFNLVAIFRKVETESSQSLELAHVVNTLFLCINKLIAFHDILNEEREYVKHLIVRCLEILNEKRQDLNEADDVVMSDLTQKTKEEVYLVFLNVIKNFIELIFSKQDSTNSEENNLVFYEYIHYFVKFSIQNIKDEKIVEIFLTKFIKIPLILSNENFLACYFVNLFYFTIDLKINNREQNFYSQIIFNFFKQEEDESNIKIQMLKSLKIIYKIFEELNRNKQNIFCLESDDMKTRPDPNFISLNLINKIFILIQNNFIFLDKLNDLELSNTILKICNSINVNNKSTINKMRTNENSEINNEIFKIHLKELKSFEKEIFSALSESKLIYKVILLIYSDNKEESKKMRGYILNKFNEIIIAKEDFESVNVPELFGFFLKSLRSEDNVENLQFIFSILTKITRGDEKESIEILKILRSEENFGYVLSLVNFTNDSKNLQKQFYNFSVLVFLTKVFNILPPNKFLDKFNQFIKIFVKGFDVVLATQNEELTNLILESFDSLSQHKSEFFSPHLNEILHKILLIANISKKASSSVKIHSIIKKIFETIARKQLFDNSFKSVKFCIQNLSSNYNEINKEIFEMIFAYLKTSLEQIDKVVIADMFEKIFKFFVKLLIDERINSVLSENILDCFKTFVLKMNEKQLRTIFQNILIFGKEKSEGETSLKYKLENSIVTFQILNTILKSISLVFVPYFEKYKGYWTDLLNSICSIFSSEDKRNSNKKKRGRVEFEEAYDDHKKTFSYLKLNSLLLENIKFNFKFNKENSLLNETIEDLFESLAGELKFIFFESDEEKYSKYFDDEIKTCFIEIFKNLRNDDHLKEFNDTVRI